MYKATCTGAPSSALRFPVISELSVRLATVAMGVAVLFTVVLLFYALGLRLAHVLYRHEMRRLRKHWWPVFAQAIAVGGNDRFVRVPRRITFSRLYLLREWCRFRSLVKGDCAGGLESIAVKLRFRRLARSLLHRRSFENRLLAVQALGYLGDVVSWNQLHRLMLEPNVTVSISAAAALVRIDAQDAIQDVIAQVGERENWPRTQVGRILNTAGPDIVSQPLCDAIERARPDVAVRLLRFYESAHVGDIDSLVATVAISRTDPPLLAAALKAVRGHLPTFLCKRLAHHDAWYVRMQAATLLGRFGRREDYRILEPLLSDPEWWVRYRAAQAITRLPFLGSASLQKLRERQTDPYARDIFRHALAETGVA